MRYSPKPEFGMLSSYRVILSGVSVAAPFAAQLYAEQGADVIWIENPNIIDMGRVSSHAGSFQQDRRNMRSISLNYRKGDGREAFLRLIATADVLIEASPGGSFDKAGLSDDVLWEHNPGLIIVHISGFGQTGLPEYTSRGSFDPIAQAFGCVMKMNGIQGQASSPAMPFPGDFTSSFYAFGMSLAALLKRQETGKGESIDLAQFELLMRLQSQYPINYLRYGEEYIKEGTHSLICAGYGTYQCMDGEEIYILFLGAGSVERGLKIVGLDYGDELFPLGTSIILLGTPAASVLEEALKKYFATHTAKEAEAEFCAAKVPCSRLMNYEQAVKNPQYIAREVFTTWKSADGSTDIPGVNVMPRLKNHPGRVWRGAPSIGMDNEDILHELGYSSEEIETLYSVGLLSKKDQIEI